MEEIELPDSQPVQHQNSPVYTAVHPPSQGPWFGPPLKPQACSRQALQASKSTQDCPAWQSAQSFPGSVNWTPLHAQYPSGLQHPSQFSGQAPVLELEELRLLALLSSLLEEDELEELEEELDGFTHATAHACCPSDVGAYSSPSQQVTLSSASVTSSQVYPHTQQYRSRSPVLQS